MDDNGEPLDKNYSISDFAPEAMAEMEKDCSDFLELCEREGVSPVPDYGHGEYSDSEMSGHDFWWTRNGHGAGYWDRGLGEHGDKLSALAKTYGSCDIYVGGDGKLYV
jgi:hypothetical protein